MKVRDREREREREREALEEYESFQTWYFISLNIGDLSK